MIKIDGDSALRAMLANSIGLPEYTYIIQEYNRVDVTKDAQFQKRFNYFYKVRRNEEWREAYYEIFQRYKGQQDAVSFEMILKEIYKQTGCTEASFSSKMLVTFDTSKPIWDSKVLNALDLKTTGKTVEEKQKSIIKTYEKLEKWYAKYLKTADAKKNLKTFDRMLPDYAWIHPVKKIDYMLWMIG